MARETEKRLIRTLEFLKEPQGSTITTLVRAMNNEGPQVSLKKVVQTLKGCVDNGILKMADGRVKLKQGNVISGPKSKVEKYLLDTKAGAGKGTGGTGGKASGRCAVRKNGIPKSPKLCKPVSVVGANSAEPKLPDRPSEGGSEARSGTSGGGAGANGGGQESVAERPRASVCKPKSRPKPKARCAQRCPRARARRRKQKKCAPTKKKQRRTRRKRQRKCKKKPKIQPYCKKPKSRPGSKC